MIIDPLGFIPAEVAMRTTRAQNAWRAQPRRTSRVRRWSLLRRADRGPTIEVTDAKGVPQVNRECIHPDRPMAPGPRVGAEPGLEYDVQRNP